MAKRMDYDNTPRTMTLAQAKALGDVRGFTINARPEYREYRVNVAGGTEATAYYTNNIGDAVGTGMEMVRATNLAGGR